MSFQAKKLRVQLPCGEGTLIEPELAAKPAAAAAKVEPAAAEVARGCKASCWFSWFTPIKPNVVFPGEDDDTDMLVIDPVDLPVLKAHLEAQLERINRQLSEIEGAEQALKEQDSSDPSSG